MANDIARARQALCLLLALIATATSAWSQSLAGAVCGFDGQPAAGVVVRAFGPQQQRLGEVLSDERGRFELTDDVVVAAIEVQNEGVVLQRAIAKGSEHAVRVTFVGAAYFTLRGHVVAPDGAPVAGMDLVCRDAAGRAVTVVSTDPRGAFLVRSGEVVTDLLVDPLGWRHVVSGPFEVDRGIAVDLRLERDAYFTLRGRVVGDDGEAAAAARVAAFAKGERIGHAVTGRDGTFVLWLHRAADELCARQSLLIAQRKGLWQAAGEVDLDARLFGTVLVTGRFVDANGDGIARCLLFAVDRKVPPAKQTRPLGVTDARGNFRVLVPRGTPFLFGIREGSEHQAFAAVPASGPVELRSQH